MKIIGATAHFVNEELNQGPMIVQEVIHMNHKYSIDGIKQGGEDAEVMALSKSLKYIFENRMCSSSNKTILFN